MKTKKNTSKFRTGLSAFQNSVKKILMLIVITLLTVPSVFAHCDSWDGPVVKDALKALETNNVTMVFKWINKEQEKEITSLFNKTYGLKTKDQEIYKIVEKYFFETMVRLHRETEGAPYTGLKPTGNIKPIIQLTDKSIETNDIKDLTSKLNNHILKVIKEKYDKVAELNKVKDKSVEKGREYVKAYIDYTHTIEALHDIIEHGSNHGQHSEH